MNKAILFLFLFFLIGCTKEPAEFDTLSAGDHYLFELLIDEANSELIIPFQAEVKSANKLHFINAEEEIEVTDIRYKEDSIFIKMPVFGSEFKGQITEGNITGYWHNYNREDYAIPFEAKKGEFPRFAITGEAADISGKYKVTFTDDEGETTRAIGLFKQVGNKATGTFLTETGDYRYLQGNVDENGLRLSTFDGAHAFVFEAKQSKQGELKGTFRSGKHWFERWEAVLDETVSLTNPDELTYLLPGFKNVHFEFPDETGTLLKFPNEFYNGKVTILQISGTWCPNCMDETRYFRQLYEKYHDQGLEIITLDFEPIPTLEYFKPRAQRFKKDLEVTWPVLLAGPSDKKEAVKSLPMLNHILSYPTSIFIDKNGAVRKIHTGFNGPGTGESYSSFTASTEKLLENMLSE